MTALDTTGANSAAELDLAGVELPRDRVVGGADVLAWLSIHRALGLTAFQLGVLERALELTAEYARTREQFDRPIGSFQAAQRLADGYIDIQGLRLTPAAGSMAAVGRPARRGRGGDRRVLGG